LWFSTVPPGELWDSTSNKAMAASFQTLSNSSFTYHAFHLTIWHCIAWVTERQH
jgi:hypothetical protein